MTHPQNTRAWLHEFYLDYVNNYISVAKFAEHRGLHEQEAYALLRLAETVYNNQHPDA